MGLDHSGQLTPADRAPGPVYWLIDSLAWGGLRSGQPTSVVGRYTESELYCDANVTFSNPHTHIQGP